MKKLIRVGRYREQPARYEHSEADLRELMLRPSMRDFISDTPQENEEKIAEYLDSGLCLFARGGWVEDVLDPAGSTQMYAGGGMTDGTYFWSSTLSYYVRKYHLRLPADFLAHMAALNWSPPPKGSLNTAEFDW